MIGNTELWKYGDPPALETVRKHISQKSRLLVVIPNATCPMEAAMVRLSPNNEYVYLAVGDFGLSFWLNLEDVRIVDILPKLKIPAQVPPNSMPFTGPSF